MPPRSLLRGFLLLWVAAGLVLFVGAAETVRAAWTSAQHANPHITLLGAVEAIAALAFLMPRTMRVGAAGLIATITIALGAHAALGQYRGDLLLYGVVVLFVAIHGPLTSAQWRAAVARPGPR